MGNCCSRASDAVVLLPNEVHIKDHIIYDKDFDHTKKPKIRIFHKGSSSSTTSQKKEKNKRNPATGEKNPSLHNTPSPSLSKTNLSEIELIPGQTYAFDNPSFEPSSLVQEQPNNTNENNNTKVNKGLQMSTEIEGQVSERDFKNISTRQKEILDKDKFPKNRRPSNLPPLVDKVLPTLEEDPTQPKKQTIMKKPSGPIKNKSKNKLTGLPLLEFKTAMSTPSYENEFSPIVSEIIVVKDKPYCFNHGDLTDISGSNCLGSGGFGVVSKMLHGPSGYVMAVKRVRIRVDISLKRELAAMEEGRNIGSFYIVDYYGSLKHNGEVWIAMELMKASMDKVKIKIYDVMKKIIPEHIIRHISYCICSALYFLKKELRIIHRDVKPSNMLVGEDGIVKICDFGISGPLVESRAKTKEIGCRPYMAPERLDPDITQYTVESDVWSFGISMMELMTGVFPYEKFSSYFEQWNEIVRGNPPQLYSDSGYSAVMRDFINPCLNKEPILRPSFQTLLNSKFLVNQKRESGKESMKEWMEQMNI